jgi:FkbM family methyltransferase
MAIPSRIFTVQDTEYVVCGWSEDDQYLNQISGKFEYKFQELCRIALRPDDVALDIGANIGVTSVILSQFLHSGHTFAIEPGNRVFELLEGNIGANQIKNVTCVKCAISSRPGTMEFHEDSAYGHVVEGSQAEIGSPIAVRVTTIDDLVEHLGIERLDFIKIDTEGFEPQVFAGARKTLMRFKPLVLFELNTWTLLVCGKNDPLKFTEDICKRFGAVYRINKDISGLGLEPIDGWSPDDIGRRMIHDNVALHGSWDDYLVCQDPDKINSVYERIQRNLADQTAAARNHRPPFKSRLANKLRRLIDRLEGV